jgi:hypothetical protein
VKQLSCQHAAQVKAAQPLPRQLGRPNQQCIVIIIIKLPNKAIASTPSAPRPTAMHRVAARHKLEVPYSASMWLN